MIEQNVRKKLKLEPSKDDFQEVLEQLKREFNGCAKKSEKLQILTILPQSWSIKRIETEFGATNHMARLAKALVARKEFWPPQILDLARHLVTILWGHSQ